MCDRSLGRLGTLRRPELRLPTELRAAIREVVVASSDEIVLAVAYALGFKGTSAQLREAIATQIEGLSREGAQVV